MGGARLPPQLTTCTCVAMNGRVRVKRGKNVKRWKKGQSGGSNPVSHKHRDAAKGRFGNHLVQVL